MATVSAMFTITDTGDLSGRNLIQRSFFTKDPWTGPNYNAVGDGFGVYHDRECLPVETRNIYWNTNNGADNIFPDLTFEPSQQYTISGKAAQFRTDDMFNNLYIRFHHTDGSVRSVITSPNTNGVWKDFHLTSYINKTVAAITVTYDHTGITYIADFKLEVGASATDWTPAPEDVNTALINAKEAKELANSKNSVYYQTTAPTGTHKVGDTWFDTGNDYKIRRWNGSSWAAAELGDQAVGNLNASHINAGTLTAVDIEAGKAQDVAGTIKVYDEDDDVKVSLDKDGLKAAKGIVGGWTITDTAIQHEISTSSPIDYIQLSSAANSITLQKGSDRVAITSKYIRQQTVKQTAADEPTIAILDGDISYSNVDMPIPNEDLMSFRKWTEVSASRVIKDSLSVTIYHCMNLFWAHFSGTIPAGWTDANTQNVFIPIITDDTNLTNSAKVAPPAIITKYIVPTDLANRRISVTVRPDGQIGISRVAEPFKGNAATTIAGYMETCDIFWAHIG